jgi:hypothetical protein
MTATPTAANSETAADSNWQREDDLHRLVSRQLEEFVILDLGDVETVVDGLFDQIVVTALLDDAKKSRPA